MKLNEKKVLVVGLGDSGMAAAEWLIKQGSIVTVSEKQDRSDLDKNDLDKLTKSGVRLELGEHYEKTFTETDLIVVSPGVSLDIKPLVKAREKGILVVGELEIASRFLTKPAIAVTGTNGKSTVVTLIRDILLKAGKRVYLGGNIGYPLINYVGKEELIDYFVLEVSSFQLDTIESFSPLLAVILNISPDHLDRYADYNSYARSKEKIFLHQGPGQGLILNADDKWLEKIKPDNGSNLYRYGLTHKSGHHAFLNKKEIIVRLPGKKENVLNLEKFVLPGNHNVSNVMAAVLTSLILRVPRYKIQEAIDDFKGLPHRCEFVRNVKGVDFYDDSKATNVDAAIKSVTCFSKKIILIAGGRHKGGDYTPLVDVAYGRVKEVVLLGEASDVLAKTFSDKIKWSKKNSMFDAVHYAFFKAHSGDVVLLAPACSSFDMFKDYKQRGNVFKMAVQGLRNG